jgi:outer membrane protein assembly factor BamB
MKRYGTVFLTIAAALAIALAAGAEPAATGWRGNGTGLWPDATPPLEWSRAPRGALDGLRAVAARPSSDRPGDAPLVEKGLLRDWLVIGPFPVKDSVRDLDADALKGEATARPAAADRADGLAWTKAAVGPDDFMVFGTAELPWLNLAKVFGYKKNQIGYAHTCLYSPRGGPARIVVDHSFGLKAWLNCKLVYRSPRRDVALGSYPAISKHELNHLDQPSPRFDLTLRPGWNGLLLKLASAPAEGHNEMRCSLRIIDPPDVPYRSKNLRWMTPLPGRSTSTPIVVGDRLFVMAEPDQLLCIDKGTGKVLWAAAINPYEALPPEERRKNPAFAAQVDPLVAKLAKESDPVRRTRLRAEIHKALVKIDEAKFTLKGSGHFESHFGIVGFTMPTPVSDGKHVWVWSGMGVAACFDLAGKRKWITRIEAEELNYGSSPALADGVLVVFQNCLYGLDARTGKRLWEQPKVRYNIGAVQGVVLGGRPVALTQRGDVVNPSDGALLFWQRESSMSGDTGWAPPVALGDRVYSPKYGVTGLRVFDYAGVKEAPWKPKLVARLEMPPEVSRRKNGGWIDRWTAGSPLVHEGLVYQTDIYQTLYVSDLKSGKLLYRQEMELSGLTHYNAVAVAASPTLVGKHVLVCDNQGTTLVLEPGPKYRVVARNRIATQIDRRWPIPAQETIGYAPPVADGGLLFLRGEAHLYCVGVPLGTGASLRPDTQSPRDLRSTRPARAPVGLPSSMASVPLTNR